MSIRIQSVTPLSPADKAGIRDGETLVRINSEPVTDEIDYHLQISLGTAGPVSG